MKIRAIILPLLAVPMALAGQELPAMQADRVAWSVTPYAGVNLAGISNSQLYAFTADEGDVLLNSKTKAGLVVGADLEHSIGQQWGAIIGLNYAQQGCKFDSYIDPTTMKEMRATRRMHYLNLTIKPKLYVGGGFAFEAGVQVGALLAADMRMEANGKKDYSTDMTAACNRVAVSIPVGMSFSYQKVQLRLLYHFPLSKLSSSSDIPKEKNRQLSLTAGYRLDL